jgi:hypothetical protein
MREFPMADKDWLLLGGGLFGLMALIAFLAMRREEAPAADVPPPIEVQERIWEQMEAPPMEPVPTAPGQATNACGSARFGYPDFAGTPRVGQKCVDDWDCQQHPPVGFPYYQQCCIHDGTCFT